MYIYGVSASLLYSFSPVLFTICVYNMFMIYVCIYIYICIDVDIDIDVCFISALLLLHYCFTSLSQLFAPAFTRAVLMYICFTSVCLLLNTYIYIDI